jgi:hypothetical protein
VVPYSVEHLKAAPSLDDDDELSAEREREIYDHYARVGYWDEARDAIKARQTPPAPDPPHRRGRGGGRHPTRRRPGRGARHALGILTMSGDERGPAPRGSGG